MAQAAKVEVVPAEASAPGVELVAQGNALIKLENDTMMKIAIQRPRDESKILAACLKELDVYPSLAEEALYSKPVGKDDKGEMKYAEGLSIRAAESICNRWDNSAYAVDQVDDAEDFATIAAVFLDYERCTKHVAQVKVSKFYTTRDKKVVRYTPDRFDMVLKSGASKALREILLRSIPAGLKKEYELKVRDLLNTEKLPNRRKKMVAAFATLGVTEAMIEKYIGKPVKDLKHDELNRLLGTYNGIKEGEQTKEEVFGKPEEKKAEGAAQANLIPKE